MLDLLWMVVIYFMVLFSLENYMFGVLVYMFMVIFTGGVIMSMTSSSVWMSMIFLIFMVGGLMVSFFYMVSLTHNMVLKIIPHVFLLSLILTPYFNSQDVSNFNIVYSNSFFLFSSLSYLILVLFMLALLFLILFLIDFKLKAMKGFIKEI
uniref:NADH dehydrogenase subunit 6 n=1 Tax=Liposcelis bostrychophila TaxID=185214 RepID=A0A3Q8BY41_LIPBO|nr:NADH dehydrogenase subunit 6 [Liposcelis bostrychophila]ATU74577.1 NADH dehydrogenase subunit 6 [Liposcelis bostrychophila]